MATRFGKLARSHSVANTPSVLARRWADDYIAMGDGATTFGILKRCAWLAQMWESGKVAFICGALGDSSRDHELSQRNLEMGARTADKTTYGNGWGGRLAAAAQTRVVALTRSPLRFASGPPRTTPSDLSGIDASQTIPIADSRHYSLPGDPIGQYGVGAALREYYPQRAKTVSASSPFRVFFDHERRFREFGALIDARLAAVPLPAAIKGLENLDFDMALQIRNLYDAIAMHDVLGARIASMEYAGQWDSHAGQRAAIEPSFEKLFGATGGLAALFSALPAAARSRLVVLIGGEFGRQLRDNGGNGTDHGEGTVFIVIGEPVRGGVYGTMFPEEELQRINRPGADTRGVNALEHIFGAVCDWVMPGGKPLVFPNFAAAPKESNFDLENLLAT